MQQDKTHTYLANFHLKKASDQQAAGKYTCPGHLGNWFSGPVSMAYKYMMTLLLLPHQQHAKFLRTKHLMKQMVSIFGQCLMIHSYTSTSPVVDAVPVSCSSHGWGRCYRSTDHFFQHFPSDPPDCQEDRQTTQTNECRKRSSRSTPLLASSDDYDHNVYTWKLEKQGKDGRRCYVPCLSGINVCGVDVSEGL